MDLRERVRWTGLFLYILYAWWAGGGVYLLDLFGLALAYFSTYGDHRKYFITFPSEEMTKTLYRPHVCIRINIEQSPKIRQYLVHSLVFHKYFIHRCRTSTFLLFLSFDKVFSVRRCSDERAQLEFTEKKRTEIQLIAH